MKITVKDRKDVVDFSKIPSGMKFIWNNELWMKVKNTTEYKTAVNLETGELNYFNEDAEFVMYTMEEVILQKAKK